MLLNIAVSDEEKLTTSEADRVKNRIQSYAAMVDDNGVQHLANIIWGASIKPELGDSIETIIVATGFPASEDYYNKVLDKQDVPVQIPTPGIDQPSGSLTGFKTGIDRSTPGISPKPDVPNVIAKPTRNYTEVERRKQTPAFIARKINLVTKTSGAVKKAVSKDEDPKNTAETATGSNDNKLF